MDLKKLLIVGGVILAIILGIQYFKKTDQRAFHDLSKGRVQNLFDNLKSGRTADEQDAMGYWRVGHPETATEANLRSFERFMEAKSLPTQIKTYEFISSELVAGDDVVNRHVRLECKVDGQRLSMVIHHKLPIEWAN